MTSSARAAPPCATAAIAAAHAPVPDDSVGPTPRSQIRMRTRSGASISANSTFVPCGNSACRSSIGPSRSKRSSDGSGPSTTHCGLPIEKADSRTSSPPADSVNLRTADGWPIAARKVNRGSLRATSVSARGPASVAMTTSAPGTTCEAEPRCRIAMAASARRPLPDNSAALPSALIRRMDAPSAVRSYRISPSPPAPRCRSQRRRAAAGTSPAPSSDRRTNRKSFPYAWPLIRCMRLGSACANCDQVPPEPLDPAARQRVECPDERAVEERALPAAVETAPHGEPLRDQLHVAETREQPEEARMRVRPDHGGIDVLEIDFHQLRERVQPGDAVVDLEERATARTQHAAALRHEPYVIGGVLHDAVREHVVERGVAEREIFAVRDCEARGKLLTGEVLRGQPDSRARRINARGLRSAAREVHQVDAGAAPDVEHAACRRASEFHQARQVVQLLEVILIKIGEEAGRPDGVPRDGQIVDVRVPVPAHAAPETRFLRNWAGHDTLL